jgi:hypothetical protein
VSNDDNGRKDVSDQAVQPEPLSRFNGFLILLLVVTSIVGWIILGTALFGLTSFFATFMFAWYWVNVEQGDFKQWPHCLIGAITGVALTWQSQVLVQQFGSYGLIAGLLVIIAAIYVQIMNWVPMALNRCTMLFVTVLAAPALMVKMDFIELLSAIAIGAVYFAGVLKLALLYASRRQEQP